MTKSFPMIAPNETWGQLYKLVYKAAGLDQKFSNLFDTFGVGFTGDDQPQISSEAIIGASLRSEHIGIVGR